MLILEARFGTAVVVFAFDDIVDVGLQLRLQVFENP